MVPLLLPALLAGARAQDGAPAAELAPEAAERPEPPAAWYVGLPLAQVSLEATQGGLPEENLDPLLRARQGEILDAGAVRADIALLQRVGQFAAVEAVAEPWPAFDPETGEPALAVRLIYRVYSPPRLREVELTGARGAAERVAAGAVGVSPGDPFYAQDDLPALQARVQAALVTAGWAAARVQADVSPAPDSELDLRIVVTPGEPLRFGEITVALGPGLPERKARRWLRQEGLTSGRRIDREAPQRARDRLRREMTEDGVRGGLLGPRRWWLEARVNVVVESPTAAGVVPVSVLIEPGPSLEFARRGRGIPSADDLREVLQLYPGEPVREADLPEHERALVQWFQERGYRTAEASVGLEDAPGGQRLVVRARRGGVYELRRIRISGAESFSEKYLAAAMEEAASETLGRNIVTDGGIAAGLEGLEEFYRGQGFLQAQIRLVEVVIEDQGFAEWWRAGDASIVLEVEVEEGPRTWLRNLTVVAAEETEPLLPSAKRAIREARGELVSDLDAGEEGLRPYSLARLEALQRAVVEAYQAEGYLGAEARVEVSIAEPDPESGETRHFADAVLRVDPGSPVRLRGLVIQGNQRTDRDVIEREVALKVGEPITPEGLSRTRSHLYDLGLFRVVNPELIGDDDRSRDLLLTVVERPNVYIEAGGGLSTDQGALATAQAGHRNLLGRAMRLTALGQVGYGWLGDAWSLDTGAPVWKAAIRYEAPYIPGPGQRLSVEGLINEVVEEPTFRLSRSGGSVGLHSEWRPGIETVVDYRVQARRLEDVDPGTLVAGDPWLDVLGERYDPTLPSPWRLTSGPGVQLLWDARNDRFNPSRGWLASVRLEGSDGLAGGDRSARGLLRAEQLFPLPLGGMVLKIGQTGGVGWSGATLPVEERFFLGGSGSLRGFALNSVGPANLTPRPAIDYPSQIQPIIDATVLREEPNHWVFTGGDTLLAGSLELRVPFSRLGWSVDGADAVGFADVGQVFFRDPAITTESGGLAVSTPLARVGLGLGVRVATPVGPAAVDVGFNPWPMVERDEQRAVVHLSLGSL